MPSAYLHRDDAAGPVTVRFDISGGKTAADGLKALLAAVRKAHPSAAAGDAWGLCDDDGKVLGADTVLAAGADLFLAEAAVPSFHFYVHCSSGTEITAKVDAASLGLKASASVADLVRAVVKRHIPGADPATLEAALGDDEAPAVAADAPLFKTVKAADDVFLRRKAAQPAAAAAPPAAAAAPAVATAEESDEEDMAALRKFLAAAENATEAKQYARAIDIYSQVLEVAPGQAHCLRGRAYVKGLAERWKDALVDWDSFMAVCKKAGQKLDADTSYSMAEALVNGGRHDEAVALLTGQTLDCIKAGGAGLPDGFVHDYKVLLGHAYRGSSKDQPEDTAIALWVSVLEETGQKHCGAMLAYAAACQRKGNVADALQGLLMLLVSNSQDKQVRRAFGTLLRELPDGVARLRDDLGLFNAQSGDALAFLACVAKDFGAIAQSSALYGHSCVQSPGSASFALCYAHALEIEYKIWDSVQVVADFCRRNPTRGVPSSDGGRVTCADVLPLLEACVEKRDAEPWLSGERAAERAAASKVIRWISDGVAELPSADAPEPMSTDATVPENLRPVEQRTEKKPHGLTAEELDLTALWVTAVKSLFALGAVAALPPLVVLIDRLRRGRDLHLTTIRNEQAYFCTVAALLQYLPLGGPAPGLPRMYVCGDSHSFTPSWHTVRVRGREHLLDNRLVTGLKCWHLRPESHFYPKYNFRACVETIPKGAPVLMNFGEIDCREGILFAVERAKYSSVDEGMAATVAIYVDALLQLQRERSFEIYVHPPLPVLDPTRSLVVKFDRLLGKALTTDPRVKANGRIRWLDFHLSLLTADQKDLLPEYRLDGTHINPAYVELLQKALDTVA
eukprot:TRINITY_DN8476_c0_g1_i1.p1 TRINITY_DN8476_c0_g1~~TRINITY_DN8476_c0_g1_i1.p1  ORF type:complete len:851 (+),score=309.44 TRINITY_DN8476_c0_g1_i1:63-2615(+)